MTQSRRVRRDRESAVMIAALLAAAVALYLIVVALCALVPARAQDGPQAPVRAPGGAQAPVRAPGVAHGHPPQDAALHEKFYSTWMRPDMPQSSCCNDRDCYPTEARFANGRWFAKRREDGRWLAVPAAKIERNRDMPDARAHLCAPPPEFEAAYEGGFICFGAGGGS